MNLRSVPLWAWVLGLFGVGGGAWVTHRYANGVPLLAREWPKFDLGTKVTGRSSADRNWGVTGTITKREWENTGLGTHWKYTVTGQGFSSSPNAPPKNSAPFYDFEIIPS